MVLDAGRRVAPIYDLRFTIYDLRFTIWMLARCAREGGAREGWDFEERANDGEKGLWNTRCHLVGFTTLPLADAECV